MSEVASGAFDLIEALYKRGSYPARLAKDIGVHHSTVIYWDRKGVPAERVLDVERLTGIPRHQLRPDIYPRDR